MAKFNKKYIATPTIIYKGTFYQYVKFRNQSLSSNIQLIPAIIIYLFRRSNNSIKKDKEHYWLRNFEILEKYTTPENILICNFFYWNISEFGSSSILTNTIIPIVITSTPKYYMC